MRNFFGVFSYVAYLLVSSAFLYYTDERLIHLLNIIPCVLLLLYYLQCKNFKINNEDFLPLLPLIILPIVEIFVMFLKESENETAIALHSFYFLVVHISYLLILRKEGSSMLTFTTKDYYLIFPIILATFFVFGFLFLSKVPDFLMLILMCVSTLTGIFFAHVLNRKEKGIRYWSSTMGGVLLVTSYFLLGYHTFIAESPFIYCVLRVTYFFGLYLLTMSFIPIYTPAKSNITREKPMFEAPTFMK